jgi:methyl-accepting chemotaxis protein I, serine sensor receptor
MRPEPWARTFADRWPGTFSFELLEQFASEYETLREDFNASLKQLVNAIGAVSQTVHSIDNGTNEIASRALDLSKRTEQQAASLKETAAALDAITSMSQQQQTHGRGGQGSP